MDSLFGAHYHRVSVLPGILSNLLETGKYSDLKIKCHGRVWNVHRAIVCPHSNPLAAALNGNFKEATTGEIELEDDNVEIVGHMITFIYKSDYLPSPCRSLFALSKETPTTTSTIAPPPNVAPNHQASIFSSGSSTSSTSNSHHVLGGTFPSPANSTSAASKPQPLFSGLKTSTAVSSTVGTAPPTLLRSFQFPSVSSIATNASSTTPSTSAVEPRPEHLITHAKVYVLGEKWAIESLKALALIKYTQVLRTAWNSLAFVESLKIIHEGTPKTSKTDDLRALAAKEAGIHTKELLDSAAFSALCTENGEIAMDVFSSALAAKRAEISETQSTMPRYKVNSSHKVFRSHFGSWCGTCRKYVY